MNSEGKMTPPPWGWQRHNGRWKPLPAGPGFERTPRVRRSSSTWPQPSTRRGDVMTVGSWIIHLTSHARAAPSLYRRHGCANAAMVGGSSPVWHRCLPYLSPGVASGSHAPKGPEAWKSRKKMEVMRP